MSGTDVRWSVQRPPNYREDGRWDDVGADGGFEVETSGALIFRDAEGDVLIAYAPHAWETVTPA